MGHLLYFSPAVRLAGCASVALLAALAGACSDRGDAERVASEASAIIEGTPSPAEEDFTVLVTALGRAHCTGTLIAPNAVLTALHCVSEWDPLIPFTCNESDGTVAPIKPGGGTFSGNVPAEEMEVRVGPAPLAEAPAAYGARIFTSGSDTVCRDDIAVVVLDRNLEPPPQRIRLGQPLIRGDYQTIIGYGQTESSSAGVRHRRSGLRVLAVGEFGSHRAQGVAIPRSFLLGPGFCHGDSGSPVLDEETGAVTGVASRLDEQECEYSDPNTAIQVAAFETLIREALEYAGFDPLVEIGGEAGAGSGGASAGEAGAGGEDTGGAGSNEGGAPGVAGGEASEGGSDSGAGGEPTAGSASGTPGGTGRAGAGGSAAGGNGAAAGEGENEAGRDGDDVARSRTRVVTDGGCGCRVERGASKRSAAWTFLSLLLVTGLRRRRR